MVLENEGSGKWRVTANDYRYLLWEREDILELESGDSCTTFWICWKPQNHTLQTVNRMHVSFISIKKKIDVAKLPSTVTSKNSVWEYLFSTSACCQSVTFLLIWQERKNRFLKVFISLTTIGAERLFIDLLSSARLVCMMRPFFSSTVYLFLVDL